MADGERLYILKTVDGEEYGPVDQDCLIRWAQGGRITAYCQIRSTLLARWENACEIPFLRELLLEQMEQEQREGRSLWDRIKARATMKAVEATSFGGLHHVRPQDFESASLAYRILAGISDAIILLLTGVFVYLFFALVFSMELLYANEAFYLGFVIFYTIVLMYFTIGIASFGQTAGQRFWGVIVIQKKGEQFYLGRAFVYTVVLLLVGVFTPFFMFVVPSKRSLQEVLTNTRMVRVKLVGKRR